MGSLTDTLLLHINTTMVRDSNYDIALQMVKNIRVLSDMSIDEVADMCHVSRASISRFCHFMGFSNFKEFKAFSNIDFSIKNDYTKAFLKEMKNNLPSVISDYKVLLNENINSVLNEDLLPQLKEVAKEIHEHDHVAYFGQYIFQELGMFLQSKLMLMGKYIETYTYYDGQKKCAESLDKKSVAILCTVGGSYFTRHDDIWDDIVSSGCKTIVITQNTGNVYLNQADYVIPCGIRNNEGTGKYAALLLLEYLIIVYMNQYNN